MNSDIVSLKIIYYTLNYWSKYCHTDFLIIICLFFVLNNNQCFGINLVSMLFNTTLYSNDLGFGPSDMPVSDFTAALANSSAMLNDEQTIWSGANYQAYPAGTVFPNTNSQWFYPGIERQRGSGYRRYSQILDLAAVECQGFDIAPLSKPFPRENIIISTKGFCGSTCALFTGHAHFYERIQTVVSGGLASQVQQQFFAFPGIQVVDSPDFYSMFQILKFNITTFNAHEINDPSVTQAAPLTPRLMATTARYRYCIREQYEQVNRYSLPTEYSFVPADFHWPFTYEMATQPTSIWERINIQFF